MTTPIPVVFHDGKKTFTVLENNPEVMTPLAHKLGLDTSFRFHDVLSFTDPDLLSFIPRPVYALLVIIPFTQSWHAIRTAEDRNKGEYTGKGPDEPVIWFKQTIGHACGSIGLTHCLINGPAKPFIQTPSFLSSLLDEAIPLDMAERAQWLYDSKEFENLHQSVAGIGDTAPPSASEGDRLGQHFVAFVKGGDGCLWELEGGRAGPLNRGLLSEDEDVLSPHAMELGLGRIMKAETESGGGDLRFSALALCRDSDTVLDG